MSEKRRHVRVKPDKAHPLEIQVMGSGFLDIMNALDISESGISIEVESKFEGCNIAAPVELIITLPKNITFKARGVIRHANVEMTRRGIFGVEFTWIQDGYSEKIKHYIKTRMAVL